MYKVAVIGFKGFEDYALLSAYVDLKLSRVSQSDTIEIVTSHSKSTVEMAMKYAEAHGYSHRHFAPEPQKYFSQAYPKVNEELLTYVDSLIVFWDGAKNAAGSLVEMAKEASKPLAVKKVESTQMETPPKAWPANLLTEAQVLVSGPIDETRLDQALRFIKMNDRVQQALFLRYKDDFTLQMIGEQFDVTRERARQLCEKGIKILHARRADVASILETGTVQRLQASVPLNTTSLRKTYVDTLALLGIHTIGELRQTPDYIQPALERATASTPFFASVTYEGGF